MTADEIVEIERTKGKTGGEDEVKPAGEGDGSSDSGPLQPGTQSRGNQQNVDSEKSNIGSDSQVGGGLPLASVGQEPGTPHQLQATKMGRDLFGTNHMCGRGRILARSRSLSVSRSTGLSEFTMAPRSRSAGTETSTELAGSMTRSSSGTDEEDSWSSEEETTPVIPKLSGDQRNHVERVMETFWDVMNKNWRSYVRERTKVSGDTGASSANGNSQRTSSSGTSTLLLPWQKNLGKRPANDDEKDNEERPPKRNRNDSNNPIDTPEKIKLSCPYRKQNRQKYNVHTHRTCALSGFPDIARVKYAL